MTEQQIHAYRPELSLDDNLTDEERLALRTLVDAWAPERRTAQDIAHDRCDWQLPLETELAIAATIERYILDRAGFMRRDAEGIEERARERLAELDEAMQRLRGEPELT
jgi:hypothetical protein